MAKRRGNGEGSITKRKDGRWQGYVTVGYDPETDKPKKKYFYGKTKKEVQQKITETLGKVQNGTYQEPSKLKLHEWFNTWLEEYMKHSLRPTTWASYEEQVNKHILPAIGHLKLNQLQTSHLQKLYNDKLHGGRLDGKSGGLSPRSVRYIHTIIHAALEQAKKEFLISINPSDAAKLPSDPKKEIQCFNSEEVKVFLSNAKETRHFPLYFLALNTGLRLGEILGLRWKDVDLENGTITVNQGLVRAKGKGLVFQEPKTKLSNRTIGISPEVVKVLNKHESQQKEHKFSMGEAYRRDLDLVFCNELGEPICPRGLTRHFERLLNRCNKKIEEEGKKKGLQQSEIENQKLPRVTFHGLRHTFATLSLQEGIDARTTQETLGHHKAAFTLDVYSGVTEKMKKEASSKIGNLMASCLE